MKSVKKNVFKTLFSQPSVLTLLSLRPLSDEEVNALEIEFSWQALLNKSVEEFYNSQNLPQDFYLLEWIDELGASEKGWQYDFDSLYTGGADTDCNYPEKESEFLFRHDTWWESPFLFCDFYEELEFDYPLHLHDANEDFQTDDTHMEFIGHLYEENEDSPLSHEEKLMRKISLVGLKYKERKEFLLAC